MIELAAVVWGPEQPFVIEEVLVDPPKKMEVRIKILFSSICHTDLGAWKGEVYIYIYIDINYIQANIINIVHHSYLYTYIYN